MTVKIKLDNREVEIESVQPYSGPSPIEGPGGGTPGGGGRALMLVLKHGQSLETEGKYLSYNGTGFHVGMSILTMDGLYVSE
jgi:hypothetical protein